MILVGALTETPDAFQRRMQARFVRLPLRRGACLRRKARKVARLRENAVQVAQQNVLDVLLGDVVLCAGGEAVAAG